MWVRAQSNRSLAKGENRNTALLRTSQSLSGEPYSEDTTSLEPEGLENTEAGPLGCHLTPEEQPCSSLLSRDDAHTELDQPGASCKRTLGATAMPGRYSSQLLF